MPEGPEIRRAADKLAAAVIDQPLTAVDFAFPQLKHYRQRLIGERIVAIEPRGKALLTHFSNGLTMYSHNQLYGVWKVAAAGETPETKRDLRVRLETARSAILLYSASDITVGPFIKCAKILLSYQITDCSFDTPTPFSLTNQRQAFLRRFACLRPITLIHCIGFSCAAAQWLSRAFWPCR